MRVIAIIPAFNEDQTIGSVIEVLKEVPFIADIMVVSDGSTDDTAEIAKNLDVRVVELDENLGKGGAMKVGVDRTRAEVILFLDADLIGLTTKHVNDLLEPVIKGEAGMTVGVFEGGRVATDLAQRVVPQLSGQRAVRRELLQEISDIDMTRFGVEMALNLHIENTSTVVKEVVLEDLSHVIKEEKMGVVKGFAARMKMYWEIVRYLALK